MKRLPDNTRNLLEAVRFVAGSVGLIFLIGFSLSAVEALFGKIAFICAIVSLVLGAAGAAHWMLRRDDKLQQAEAVAERLGR